MSRKITAWMCTFCLILGSLGLMPQAGAAAPAGSVYETSFANTDTALSGVSASEQEYFQIMDYWNIEQVRVRLDYKASPLASNEESSVTLRLNGRPFYSFRPVVSDQQLQQVSVTVPKALVVKGTNTLSIEGNIRTLEASERCPAEQPRDNWLQLFNTSSVAVEYHSAPITNSISDFNRHFIGLDMVSRGDGTIVVPEAGEPAELETAVYALSGFAKANSLKEKAIPLAGYGQEQVSGKKALVFVAMLNNLPAELKSKLSTQDLANKALIQLVDWKQQKVLVITSASEEMLVKAGRLMANQELVEQLNAGVKQVDGSTEVAAPELSIGRTISLTETGDSLTGQGHREQSYFISLPANRTIADTSKIKLDFRYAKNLDFNRSMVTLLVNNTPIGSKKLTAELADGDTLTVPIPKNLQVAGNFSVTAAFDLEMQDAYCTPNSVQQPWAYVTSDSVLQLNTQDRTELLFNNYPYPFLRDGSFNQVAVVLPKSLDSHTFYTLSNLFNLLGQYAESNSGEVKFYRDDAAAKELEDRQIIAIGSYKDNKVIRDSNDKLYFQYDDSGSSIRSNEKMSIEGEYGKRIGALQLIESPYGAGHGLLAVTGASSEAYDLASKLLASEAAKYKVYGDAVVTDKDGNVQAYRFKKETEDNSEGIVSQILDRKDVLGFAVAAVLVLALVLISLIFMIRKYRKGRREER
ncbi:cellulose biosynthesis cyclic di-GMP-binding regulatory protein BcsB [Paenibacillus sp. CAA11]|uniref:cellulose biosynthesis cyclic di-GMP-binding regulatory protein BcsB n=1 Tax=Paenibacillus sp. CAA11 TaxID=1532905 RepID=UPI00131EFC2E|nr:cellulose biosynthesis cyclic di-GMP-binding regulatory protein BcsB [Paenibacillus sp. CAA11]